MRPEEQRLAGWIAELGVDAELLVFDVRCHSVAEAAAAANATPDDFVKNICMVGSDDRLIVAIVHGRHSASTSRVARALDLPERPRLATPDEIAMRTGYGFGGTPSFGYEATFLVDPAVVAMDVLYTGGGSDHALVRTTPTALLAANNGRVVRIRR